MKSRSPLMTVSTLALVAVASLAACSSSTPADTAVSAIDAASAAAAAAASADAAGAGVGGTDAMRTLCAQMVADGLSPEAATALAETNGFIARVGTIDGEPMALTMDYREDRFTFETKAGVVIGCTYG
ncbi:MAG: hypothetical protein NTX29_07940 [Actinobacteria bacterium]|nr:hypothetical protein [Actinomycetota bacterium]